MLALFTGSSRHLAGKGVGWTGASPKHFGDDFIRRSFQKLCQMQSLSWSNNTLILNRYPLKTILTLVCPSLCWIEEGSMRWNSCRVGILFLWHNPHKDQWFSEWPMRTIFLFRADKFGTLRTNKENMSWIWRWQFDILNPNLLNPPYPTMKKYTTQATNNLARSRLMRKSCRKNPDPNELKRENKCASRFQGFRN